MIARHILRLLATAGLAHFALFAYDENIIFKLYHQSNLSRDAHVWASTASQLNFFVSALLLYSAYEGRKAIQNTFRVALVYGVLQLIHALQAHEPRHHLIYLALFWALPGFLIGVLGLGLEEPVQAKRPRKAKQQVVVEVEQVSEDEEEEQDADYEEDEAPRTRSRSRTPRKKTTKAKSSSPSPRRRSTRKR